jgi:WhiB family redox-sensing transcriptional regulator
MTSRRVSGREGSAETITDMACGGQRVSDPVPNSHWQEDALCAQVDSEIFFPPYYNSPDVKIGKDICRKCPVLTECATWAAEHPADAVFGTWGGRSEWERHKGRRRHAGGGTTVIRPIPSIGGVERRLRIDQARDLAQEGLTQEVIAEVMKVSVRTVIRYLSGQAA